ITAIPALLEQLMIKGCIVTIDAMGAQKKIAEQAGTLSDAEGEAIRMHSTLEKGHGRLERRTYWYTTDLDGIIDAKTDWAKLMGIGMVKREVTMIANPTLTTTETAYFIGSVDNVADFARAARKHWGVESMHWSLDVTFGDDHNKTLDKAAYHNLVIVKRMAFNVLKNETKIKPKMSKPNKRIVAAMDLAYRDHLISQAFNQM
ncbi:ISAs1 family transposase, partial [Paenibacillus alkaliterrae]|uniref:ISAs1 family transposase n=1 Tax=Paenibacillus alkaliterrae TaxID=320909 RepID=UPI001F47CDA2